MEEMTAIRGNVPSRLPSAKTEGTNVGEKFFRGGRQPNLAPRDGALLGQGVSSLVSRDATVPWDPLENDAVARLGDSLERLENSCVEASGFEESGWRGNRKESSTAVATNHRGVKRKTGSGNEGLPDGKHFSGEDRAVRREFERIRKRRVGTEPSRPGFTRGGARAISVDKIGRRPRGVKVGEAERTRNPLVLRVLKEEARDQSVDLRLRGGPGGEGRREQEKVKGGEVTSCPKIGRTKGRWAAESAPTKEVESRGGLRKAPTGAKICHGGEAAEEAGKL